MHIGISIKVKQKFSPSVDTKEPTAIVIYLHKSLCFYQLFFYQFVIFIKISTFIKSVVVGRKCLRNWHHQQRRLEEEEQTETSDSNRQSTQMALDRTDSKDTKHEHQKSKSYRVEPQ